MIRVYDGTKFLHSRGNLMMDQPIVPEATPILRAGPGRASIEFAGLVLLGTACLAWMYAETVRSLVARWQYDPAWSHGYAVIGAFLYIVFAIIRKSGQRPWSARVKISDCVAGFVTLAAGMFCHCLGQLGAATLDAASLVIVLLGLAWVMGGSVTSRTFGGSILFLMFMVPWPFSWQQPVTEFLQYLVAVLSQGVLSLFGVPIHREGYLLLLPGQTVEVAEGCSGLRQITVFLALGVFLGLIGGDRLRGWFLAILSLPIAILANTLRISLTVAILLVAGPKWIEGTFHECEGLVTFVIGLGLMCSAASSLKRSSNPPHLNSPLNDERSSTVGLSLRSRVIGLTAALVVAALLNDFEHRAIAASGEFSTIPLNAPLTSFPTVLGEWLGSETQPDKASALYGDDHLYRVYQNQRTGQTLVAWMIYTVDGRDRVHHPVVCMRAIGYTEDREQRRTLPLSGYAQPVQRYFFQSPNGRAGQWVYHWYYVFRESGNDQSPTFWQRLLEKGGRKRSGVTIEIFAPHMTAGDAAGTEEFAKRLDEALQSHLPEGAVRGSSRGAYLMVGGTRVFNNDPLASPNVPTSESRNPNHTAPDPATGPDPLPETEGRLP